MVFSYKIYIHELQYRALLILITSISCLITCYEYSEVVLALFLSLSNLTHFILTDITEGFKSLLEIFLFITTQLIALSLSYHWWLFINPALHIIEKYKVRKMLKRGFIILGISIYVLHNFIFPMSWNFFLNFHLNLGEHVFFEARIDKYINFYKEIYYNTLLFLIITVSLLTFTRKLQKGFSSIKKFRNYLYLFFISFSTLMTPPDVLSQLVTCSIIIITYEIFLFYIILERLVRKPIKTC